MAKIVIIGAGLTGLSAAYHLEKKKFFDYKIFEKENEIGGLCRSVKQDGFTFDYTGHLLHTKDPYFSSLIKQLVGLDEFNSIQRKSFIFSHKAFTRYPFQINLFGLPPAVIAECIEGFAQRRKKTKKAVAYPEWVLNTFGKGFAKHFFFPYQKKIFAYNIHKLTARWTQNFVPQTSLEQIIEGALTDKKETSVGYNAHFYYPKQGGIVSWVQKFAQHVTNPIYTGFAVNQIDTKNKLVYFTNGHVERYDQLITTMPLDTLLNYTKERSNSFLKNAIQHLKCNEVVNFNLGFSRPDVSDKHWIYFPEKEFPFYRIGFPHNFAKTLAPKGCSSLYGEIAHINKSQQWKNQLRKHARTSIKKLLNVSESEIATEKVINIRHAYVIYDFWREKNLPKIFKRLEEQDIYSVGRYGAWKYSSMQDAVLDGKAIAQTLTVLPAKQWHSVQLPPLKEKTQKEHSS